MFFAFSMLGLVTLATVYMRSENYLDSMSRLKRADEMVKYINNNVDPCDDFYEYACGNWGKYHPIPEYKSDADLTTFHDIIMLEQVKKLVEEPVKSTDWPTDLLVKDYYASCVNMEIRRKAGLSPLLKLIHSMGGWPVLDNTWSAADFDWIDVVTKLKEAYGINIFFESSIDLDVKNTSRNAIYLMETSPGLPNKDYYYNPSKKYHFDAYKKLILEVLEMFGVDDEKARKTRDEILKFESDIAMGTTDFNVFLDASQFYVPTSLQQLETLFPQVEWRNFFRKFMGVRVNYSTPIFIGGPEYIPNLLQVISSTNQRAVANYIMWSVTNRMMTALDGRFDTIQHQYKEAISGARLQDERWKKCVEIIKWEFVLPLGSMYIRRYFKEDKKDDVLKIALEVRDAFNKSIEYIDWIDDVTRDRLYDKIKKINFTIGYPNAMLNKDFLNKKFGALHVVRNEYFANTLNLYRNIQDTQAKELYKEPEKFTTFNVVTQNAFHGFHYVEVAFSAGFLDYPFYSRYFPRSIKFAITGTVFGHEITHGFDTSGQKVNSEGILTDWWTQGSAENFKNRTKCFVDQYNNYNVNGQKLRGDPTVGENIADEGGVQSAYYAYQNWAKDQSEDVLKQEVLEGVKYTRNQLFFLNYAQLWCKSFKPEAMRNSINTDVHTPHKYRVIGPLSNFDEFSKNFQCPLGSPMNPKHKCKLW